MAKRCLPQILVLAVVLLPLCTHISAEVPQLINYQGLLSDTDGVVADSTYSLTFAIWDASVGGNSKWAEVHPAVVVTSGLFHVLLGSVSPLQDSIFNQPDRWLSVSLAGEELSRTRLTSVPYAHTAAGLALNATDEPGDCGVSSEGRVYYDASRSELCYCDGTGWVQVDGGGTCDPTVCADVDLDGYDTCDPSNPDDTDGQPIDCDDTTALISPGLAETYCDSLDNDCDPVTLDNPDHDGDGVLRCAGDCDDSAFTVHPGAPEICDNSIDDDCDDDVDCDDPDCLCEDIAPGDLVITEVMVNPAAVPDMIGEWIEIQNTSGRDLDLRGLVLSDGFYSDTLTGGLLPAGGIYVLARSTDPGFLPDYVYEDVNFGNSETVVTISYNGIAIDIVHYFSYWPHTSGASMELSISHTDHFNNDWDLHWCTAVSTFGSGDLGTPGLVNDCDVP